MSAVRLLEDTTDPAESDIPQAIKGNICRCTGYTQQFEAIRAAANRMAEEDDVVPSREES